MVLIKLSKADRLNLLRFVCSFAWADLSIQEKEREFVKKLVRRLDLSPSEAEQVEGWLQVPPPAEEIDPTKVPAEHRQLFLDAVRAVIVADGTITPEEQENLALLDELLP